MSFKPGKSGNPKGRPKGRLDRRAQWREALAGHGDDLVSKVVELALDGDVQALRLCIDRAIPAYRPAAEPVKFKIQGETLTEQAQCILAAVSRGELDPMTGKSLLDGVASFAKLVEIDEIVRRLDQLEGSKDAT